MTGLRFRRIAHAPPPERELLDVDEAGAFTMWRSRGAIVGRFAGTVPDADAVAALADAAAAADPPAAPTLPADAAGESVEVDGRSARVEAGESVPGPWGELLAACRGLLDDLRDQPAAAIEAALVDGGATVRLEHRGTASLPLELDGTTVTARAWHEGRQVGGATGDPADLGFADAGPGWAVELPVPALGAPAGARLTVQVSMIADDDGIYVPLLASAPSIEV